MVASSTGTKTDSITPQNVGNTGYQSRHSSQMFEEGRSFSGNERNKLWFNRGDGSFSDVSDLSGCDSPNDGRATIAADFDDDGDVDLFVHNLQRERHSLYSNEVGQAHGGFLKVRLEATSSQYEAIGAEVTVWGPGGSVAQLMTRGAGYASCQPPELVFGLGAQEQAKVQVRWPSGALESFGELAAGGRLLLVEGSGEAQAYAAHTRSFPEPLPAGLRLAVGQKLGKLQVFDEKAQITILDPVALAAGKPLYLNFWATYCASCVKELPDLQDLHLSGEANVVLVSMDAPLDLYDAAAMLVKRGVTAPAFYLGADAPAEGSGLGQISDIVDLERLAIPTTLVLSPEGVIERVVRGVLPAQE